MLTPGANFAEAVGVRLNLPTQGVRSVSIPGALIVLAHGATSRQTLRFRANRNYQRLCATLVGCAACSGRVVGRWRLV